MYLLLYNISFLALINYDIINHQIFISKKLLEFINHKELEKLNYYSSGSNRNDYNVMGVPLSLSMPIEKGFSSLASDLIFIYEISH